MNKKLKLEFAPGAFDAFEGTQEELDELIAEITKLAESGELLNDSRAINIDELMEDDPEAAEAILKGFSSLTSSDNRNLQ